MPFAASSAPDAAGYAPNLRTHSTSLTPVTPEPPLAANARRHPQRHALVTPAETLTWAELFERAAGAAAALHERGVRSGDKVALALPAGVDFAVALHATLLLGAAALPVDL